MKKYLLGRYIGSRSMMAKQPIELDVVKVRLAEGGCVAILV